MYLKLFQSLMMSGRWSGLHGAIVFASGATLLVFLSSPAVTDAEPPSQAPLIGVPAAASPKLNRSPSTASPLASVQLTRRERREILELRARRIEELREQHREWAVDFVARFVGSWRFEIRPSAGSGYWQPTRRGRRVYSTSDIDLRLDWWEKYEGEERRRHGFLGFDNPTAIFYELGLNHLDDATGFVTGDFNTTGESITFKDARLVPSYDTNAADFRAILQFRGPDHFTFKMMYPVRPYLFIEHWEADFVREVGE